jgi:hypothetical protein
MLRTNAPINALEKLLIENPGTSFDVKASMTPLITKVNNPNVKSYKGKVKNEKMGLTRALIRPQTIAAQIAVEKLERYRPGIKRVIKIRDEALINKRVSSLIITSRLLFYCTFLTISYLKN